MEFVLSSSRAARLPFQEPQGSDEVGPDQENQFLVLKSIHNRNECFREMSLNTRFLGWCCGSGEPCVL